MSEGTNKDKDQAREDEVLRRLLNTKPKPHKSIAPRKAATTKK